MSEVMQDHSVMSFNAGVATTIRMYKAGIKAVYWLGPPGGAKTAAQVPIAKGMGLAHRFQLKKSHHDVPEIAGLPVPDHTTRLTHYYPSADMLPPSDLVGGLLFVHDETSDENQSQQNLTCQFVYEDGLHSYRCPPQTYHFLTGNRVSDRSGANRIITKLGNRVVLLTVILTPDESFVYGANNGWNPAVLAFIKMHGNETINPSDKREYAPTFFNSFDPADPVQMLKPQFSSARSLEYLSKYCNYIDAHEPGLKDGDIIGDVAGIVGSPTALKFCAFRKIAHTMPDVEAILEGKKVAQPDKQEVLWSLALTLASRADKKNLENVFDFLDKGPMEYLSVAARIIYDTKMPGISGPGLNKMIRSPKLNQMFSGN